MNIRYILKQKWLVSLLAFIIFSAILWTVDPKIAWFNSHFFANDANRLSIILFGALAWGLLNANYAVKNNVAKKTLQDVIAEQEYNTVRGRFLGALDFLKKTKSDQPHRKTLSQLPWFFLIGAQNSGKTSLLMHSGLSFVLSKQHSKQTNQAKKTRYCDWWVLRDAVLLDIGGHYIVTNEGEGANESKLWEGLLNLLGKHIKPSQLSGIILTLSMRDLLTHTRKELELHALQLRQRLQEIQQLGKGLPIHLIITKSDLVPGYTDFFSEISANNSENLMQLDLTENNHSHQYNLAETFVLQFDQMLSRLNQQILWRLHHERNVGKRGLINNFPFQVEHLKNQLENFITFLNSAADQHAAHKLHKIYFVSTLQNETPIDTLSKSFTQTFELKPLAKDIAPHQPIEISYYVKPTLEHIIQNCISLGSQSKPSTKNWYKMAMMTGTFVAISTIAFSWSILYSKKLAQLNQAQQALIEYRLQAQASNTFTDAVRSLNALKSAVDKLNSIHLPWGSKLNFTQQQNLQTATKMAYQKALEKDLLKKLKTLLELQLSHPIVKTPNYLYKTLQSYLMLGMPEKKQSDFILDWVNSYLCHSNQASTLDLDEFNRLLMLCLNQMAQPQELDQELLTKTRERLNHYPYQTLANIILSNQVSAHGIKDLWFKQNNTDQNDILTIKNKVLQIPGIYTRTALLQLSTHQFHHAAHSAITGNWVLGAKINSSYNENQIKKLTSTIKKQYPIHYIRIWNSALKQIEPNHFTTTLALQRALNNLKDKKSILFDLLAMIREHTYFTQNDVNHATHAKKMVGFYAEKIFESFSGLNQATQELFIKPTASSKHLQYEITQLLQYTQYLTHSSDPKRIAFNLAKNRLQHPDVPDPITQLADSSNTMPEPIKSWINSAPHQTWELILTLAEQRINTIWQMQVYQNYFSNLNKRYPLYKSAKIEIDPKNFAAFFAPNGVLDKFFLTYVKPFLITDNARWIPKQRDGLGLPLAENSITQFQLGNAIQHMYFNKRTNHLLVKFSLAPIALMPIVKVFKLNIDGQKLSYRHNYKNIKHLTWTGIKNSKVNVIFINRDGKRTSVSYSGPWAIFKMFDKSNLQPTNNPVRYNITFDLNGNSAKYQVIANDSINPFISNIIDSFRLPKNLS